MTLTFLLFPLLLVGFIAWVIVVEMTLSGWFWTRPQDDADGVQKTGTGGFQRFFAIAMLAGLVGYLVLGGGSQVADNLKVLFDSLPSQAQ